MQKRRGGVVRGKVFHSLFLAVAMPGPDPYDIFARARERWARQSYPRYLSYAVVISGDSTAGRVTNTYASFADTRSGTINVRAVSAEEAAHPYVPHGTSVNVKLKISYTRHPKLFSAPGAEGDDGDIHVSKNVRVTKREQYDLLGIPLLSPTYSFGLLPQGAAPQNVQAMPPPGLKTIASVTAVRRDYDIAYDGTDAVDGAACYHLALTPRRDPAHFRLRELWIDEQRYATRQARVQGNFTAGPGPTLMWLIHFADVGSVTYITREDAMQPLRYLGRTYSSVSVAFSMIQSAAAPDITWSLSMFKTSGDILEEP